MLLEPFRLWRGFFIRKSLAKTFEIGTFTEIKKHN